MTNKKTYLLQISLIGVLFFIFGFITWLNGILIPYLKIACEITAYQSLYVAFVFYIAYTVMALPSAWLLKKTGFKNGMMFGLWIMAAGALVFIPAAYSREFIFFLAGLFTMGTGLAVLQTAANPYVTILGPKESAAKRISIMGICNKVAGALAPLILAYYILNDGDSLMQTLEGLSGAEKDGMLRELSLRVVPPYIVMSIVLFLLGIGLRLSPLPEVDEPEDEIPADHKKSATNIFQFPQLVLGVLALFFYVGAEVIAGDTIITYGISLGIEIGRAKIFTSLTLTGMIVGYLAGITLIPRFISQSRALQYSAILGIVFTFGVVFTNGWISVLFVALYGLANALVWPAIWPLALDGLGKYIKTGSALLIMAISGGAVMPLVWGKLSEFFSTKEAYLIMIPLYLFILFYAMRGHKIRSWK